MPSARCEQPSFVVLVTADTHRLEQVLANLVDNAIKYGRSQGRVTAGGKKLDGGVVEVFVRDDGLGIPPDALPRVFESFYRANRAASAWAFRM